MQKSIKKIICLTVGAATAASVAFTAGCAGGKLAGDISGEVYSNGGFAVQKGEYVYFINGTEVNTADNTYGTPVKGALMRISKTDFNARNYANVDVVVPSIVYSGNSDAGIYVYGDYVYYSTPSTGKDSDGVVQNSYLEFKSAKLDGTEVMGDKYYYQAENNSVAYRYVEVDGTVYLMYVATEDLYETGTSVTNIHSVNTKTNEDTLLAYDVASYMFDEKDLENPTVYYTMEVNRFIGTEDSSAEAYNQVYKVSADVTESDREYDFSYIDEYDAEKDPVYLNMGEFVFDGIGKANVASQFNVDGAATVSNSSPYTYTLSSFENGTLYYTRKATNDTTAFLFTVTEEQSNESDWHAVNSNPSYSDCLLMDATNVAGYEFVEVDGELKILSINGNSILLNTAENGKLMQQYCLTTAGTAPTFLFTQDHGDQSYLYYSISGANGYAINRIAYDGEASDYNRMPADDDLTYRSVNVLNLDAVSTWYLPEIIENQIIFASEIGEMNSYNYIEVCNLRNANGEMMSNEEIVAMNEKYGSIEDAILEYDEAVYANLRNALRYAQNGATDTSYIEELRQAYVDINDAKIDDYYSDATIAKVQDFIDGTGDWASFNADSVKVNGEDVGSHKRAYYIAQLGYMSEADKEGYEELLKSSYLQAYPEDTSTWWEGLETWVKVLFIVGVSLGGLIVLAAIALVVVYFIKKNTNKRPVYKKVKRAVDTTDDKSIDVYNDEE